MILINIILSIITSMHRHYYILPLNNGKNMFTMLFYKGRGNVAPYQISGGDIFIRGGKPKRDPPHEEKKRKNAPLGEKAPPKD